MKQRWLKTLTYSRPLILQWGARFYQFIFANFLLKILALCVALFLFYVAQQPPRDIMLVNVPLEFVNIPPGLEISSEAPDAVNIRLRGPQDLVTGIRANQLEVKADLSNRSAGERVIQIKASDVMRPENVEVRRIEPDTLELKLEPTRRKTVPIEVQFAGKVAQGFERLKQIVKPEMVEIEGPESKIAQVTKLMTESVQLDGRRENFQVQVELEARRQGVRLVNPGQVNLVVEIAPQKNVE